MTEENRAWTRTRQARCQGHTFKEALNSGAHARTGSAAKSECLLKCHALGILLASPKLQTGKGEDGDREERNTENRVKEKDEEAGPPRHTQTQAEAMVQTDCVDRQEAHTDTESLLVLQFHPWRGLASFLSVGSMVHTHP